MKNVLHYQILAFTIQAETPHIKTINLKYLLQHGITNFVYQMDHILIKHPRL